MPSKPGQGEKINLKFYFHTSLWCLKRFYEGLANNKVDKVNKVAGICQSLFFDKVAGVRLV